MDSYEIVDTNESADASPYLRLRLATVTAVHYSSGGQGTPSGSVKSLDHVLGRVDIQFIEWPGGRSLVPIAFDSFSNPVSATDLTNPLSQTTARCYGDVSLPSVGDVVVVGFRSDSSAIVIGSMPANYNQQTSKDLSKSAFWGNFRAIVPGEFSRLSGQQAELYHDKAGAVQIIARAQPATSNLSVDGSATSSLSSISPTAVPVAEIARITVGECYTDETFAARDMGSSGNKLVLRIKMSSGAAVKIDTAGNIEVTAAPNKSLILNGGQNGVARLNDTAKSSSTTDSAFWLFWSTFIGAFQSWTPQSGDGGAALKTALSAALALPQPSSMTSQISSSSQTVKAG